ncbi:MAG: hypothetical protein LQ340_000230 [Diploschistes diacapsis]|nr:MAG: hypothetical protein LQ340_000230 [Diploschistes diacapsis]
MGFRGSNAWHVDYCMGWVYVLPAQQTAAQAMLDSSHPNLPKARNDHNTYTLGSIGKHNVVIACLPMGSTGTSPAVTVSAHMLSAFPLTKFCPVAGIGGGMPPQVRLGGVVVSRPVDVA